MAELWFRRGLNPDDLDEPVLAIVIDPDGDPTDRAARELWLCSHDGDDATYLARTDGWSEHSLDGTTLTVDLVVYRAVLERLGVDETLFGERSPTEPEGVRLLRVSTIVDPTEYARVKPLAVVMQAPPGATLEQRLAGVGDNEDWPLVLAPPPGHAPW